MPPPGSLQGQGRSALDHLAAGRVRVSAGDVLVQPTLDCHANRLSSRGAHILRLPWPHVESAGGTGFADQAHMTRNVTAMTGASPLHWRRRRPISSNREDAKGAKILLGNGTWA